MPPVRILIVDDEPLARKRLRKLLENREGLEIVGEANDGEQAVGQIGALTPDLVFLDLQMPGLGGFEVLAAVGPERMPEVVFVTAYDEFALQAFEHRALDYLLKPFSDARFAHALDGAKKRFAERRAAGLGESLGALLAAVGRGPASGEDGPAAAEASAGTASDDLPPLRRFAVRRGEETLYVDAEKVDWIEAEEYCVRLHLGQRSYLLRGNLGSFEPRLDPQRFVRVHRSVIVNLARVRSLRHLFQGHCVAVLDDGTEVRVSRGRRAELEDRLERFG